MKNTKEQITMNQRNEKILAESNNLASINSYKNYEDIIDQMVLSCLEDEGFPEKSKSEAYFLVMNLKRLLKTSCEGFMELRKENQDEFKHLENIRLQNQ